MKIVTELEPQIKKEVVKEIPKSKILLTTFHPQKGQFVWQYNIRTKELKKSDKYETIATLKGGTKKKLIREQDCLYTVAINKENAARKFIKIIDALQNLKR
jgi:hypothetical protein